MRKELTEHKLADYCAKGYTTTEMGDELGVPHTTVQLRLRKHGLRPDDAAKFIRKFDRKYGNGGLAWLLEMRNFHDATLQEVANEFGITRQRVCQVLQRCRELGIGWGAGTTMSEIERLKAENAKLKYDLWSIAEQFNGDPWYTERVDLDDTIPDGVCREAWYALWLARGVAEGEQIREAENARLKAALWKIQKSAQKWAGDFPWEPEVCDAFNLIWEECFKARYQSDEALKD